MKEIPSNIRVPGVFAQIRSVNTQMPLSNYRIMVLGHSLKESTVDLVPVPVNSETKSEEQFGIKSQLHQTILAVMENNDTNSIYALPVPEPAGAKATADLAITLESDQVESTGIITFYIDGIRIDTAVYRGDNLKKVFERIMTSIGKISKLPVTSALDSAENPTKITFTFTHNGVIGNSLNIRLEYYGDEDLPAGVSLNASDAFTNGVGQFDVSDIFENSGDEQFDFIVCPDTSVQTMTKLRELLGERWEALNANDGRVFTATTMEYDEAVKITTNEHDQNHQIPNSPHIAVIGALKYPQSPWRIAGMVAGAAVQQAQSNPALSFEGLKIKGLMPAKITEAPNFRARNDLLYRGISTLKITSSGVSTERLITTYLKNDADNPDDSFLDFNVPLVYSAMRQEMTFFLQETYRQAFAMDDGEDKILNPGIKAVTPSEAKADALYLFDKFAARGWVTGREYFKKHLIASKPSHGRINLEIRPTTNHPLYVMGIDIGFLT